LGVVGQTGSHCHIQRISKLLIVDLRQIVPSNRFNGYCVAIVCIASVVVLLFVRSAGFCAIPALRQAIDLAGLKKRRPLCTP